MVNDDRCLWLLISNDVSQAVSKKWMAIFANATDRFSMDTFELRDRLDWWLTSLSVVKRGSVTGYGAIAEYNSTRRLLRTSAL